MNWLLCWTTLSLCSVGCSSGPSNGLGASQNLTGVDSGVPDAGADLDMTPVDFECVQRWTKVGDYRVANKLGHLAEAVAVANSVDGGAFPVGTIIQLVPTEASVKRGLGFNAASHDWEFFSLQVSDAGTTIVSRGAANVVNAFGGNCLNCHSQASAQWDMVCGNNHGCAPLPLSGPQLATLQSTDPRCP